MAWRFQGYSLVDGGRLHFDENEPRVTGFLILGGRKYKVDWAWDYSEEFLSRFAQTWAGRTAEFGQVFDAPDAEVVEDKNDYFYRFNPDQSGFAGDIAEDGSYIEWYSFKNGRCVIEGFEFRDVE